MMGNHDLIRILLLASFLTAASSAPARNPAHSLAPQVGLGAQYDTPHVHVVPDDVDKFATSFLSTVASNRQK